MSEQLRRVSEKLVSTLQTVFDFPAAQALIEQSLGSVITQPVANLIAVVRKMEGTPCLVHQECADRLCFPECLVCALKNAIAALPEHHWKQIAFEYDDSVFQCDACRLKLHQRRGTPPTSLEDCHKAGIACCTGGGR